MTGEPPSDSQRQAEIEARLERQPAVRSRLAQAPEEPERLAAAFVHARREMLSFIDLVDALIKQELSEDEYATFEAEVRSCLGEIVTHFIDTETFRRDVAYFANSDPREWDR